MAGILKVSDNALKECFLRQALYADEESSPKGLYGEVDQRKNICDLEGSVWSSFVNTVRDQSRSVACIIDRSLLTLGDAPYTFTRSAKNLINRLNVAEDDPFGREISAGTGTAFLIGKKLLLTAGHCFDDANQVGKSVIVFDFKVSNDNQPHIFSEDCIYKIKKVVAHSKITTEYHKTPGDWALVKLAREVIDREPLKLDFTTLPKKTQRLYMLGHPLGLPMKFTGNAEITRDVTSVREFKNNLDAFHGNSGSPVFCESSQQVIGILVAGPPDYIDGPPGQSQILARNDRRYLAETCQTICSLSFVYSYLKAHENDKISQTLTGVSYIYGQWVVKDEKKGNKWLFRAIELSWRQYLWSFLPYTFKGDGRAHYQLAHCHKEGIGISKSNEKYLEHLQKGCDLGDQGCLLLMGTHLITMDSQVEQARGYDYLLRVIYRPKPMNFFVAMGLFGVANACMGGKGVSTNNNKAMECFKILAELDRQERDSLVRENIPDEIIADSCHRYAQLLYMNNPNKHHDLIFEFFARAAKYNVPESLCMLGKCYISGIGTAINIDKAKEYLKKSSGLGCQDATNTLAELNEGRGGCINM